MKENWPKIFEWCLVHEGGFVNHPKDPGGATNQGVTQRVYDAFRRRLGLPERSVRDITDDEVRRIYEEHYWARVQGDMLPSGVDYAVYDFAVNSGVSRSVKYLQRVVGVTQDGDIGQITLDAVARADPEQIAAKLCDDRLAFLKRLKHWPTFGRGWARRVSEVRERAVQMAQNVIPQSLPGPSGHIEVAKGEGPASLATTIKDTLRDKGALTGVSGVAVTTALPTLLQPPAVYVVGGLIALIVFAGTWLIVRETTDGDR